MLYMKIPHKYLFDVFAWLAPGLLLLLLVMCTFSDLLGSNRCLMTTDDNIGVMMATKLQMPHSWSALWYDNALMGNAGGVMPVAWVSIMLWIAPLVWFVNWIHAFDLLLASGFLFLFLRRSKLGRFGATLGALVAFWIGSNFEIIYGGHTPKFGVLLFASAGLWALSHAASSCRRLHWSLISGGLFGFMFQEQQDLALFFGLFLGIYAILTLRPRSGDSWGLMLGGLAPLCISALLITGPTLLGSYFTNVTGVASMSTENPQAKWEFVTQWSFPPEESVALMAPGYMGWRSGEPLGPYWGRLGRAAGWEETGQGFANFKLDDWYLGVIPMAFALLACLAYWRKRGAKQGTSEILTDRPGARAEIIFWSGVTLVTFLLAMGKFSPLYQLFYHLPMVNNIRAPVKFIQVFQVALGVLTAYGADWIISQALKVRAETLSRA